MGKGKKVFVKELGETYIVAVSLILSNLIFINITNKDRLCEERTTILSWVGQARDLT